MSRREELAERLGQVQSSISRSDVTLIVVTKTYPVSDVQILHELGVRNFGENRSEEGSEKSAVVEELVTRRTGKREHEYEVAWEGQLKENTWLTRTELVEMGYQKMVNQKDEQIAMESMLGQRKLTTG